MSKGSSRIKTPNKAFNPVEVSADAIANAKSRLISYSKTDWENKHEDWLNGFNAEAQRVIEEVANGDYGFASQVAQTAVNSKYWKSDMNGGYQLSEKQAYVIAKAAVENRLLSEDNPMWSVQSYREVRAKEAAKAKAAADKYQKYSDSYVKSSTKVAEGSKVVGKYGAGTITKIITKSTGYVIVKYDNGQTRREMAFNLKGEDGNPLKKRPKPQ